MFKYLLIPSMKQWNKWTLPSKLTVVGAYSGLLFGIASLTIAIWPSEKQLYNSVDRVLLDRQREIRSLPSLQARFRFSPNLTTQKGIKDAVDEINDYGIANYQIVNSNAIERLILEHGTKLMDDEFNIYRNDIHFKTKYLTDYLSVIINTEVPKDKKEITVRLIEYVEKLNRIQNAYALFYGYINSLTVKQFVNNG